MSDHTSTLPMVDIRVFERHSFQVAGIDQSILDKTKIRLGLMRRNVAVFIPLSEIMILSTLLLSVAQASHPVITEGMYM